jgi:hypothetical protein
MSDASAPPGPLPPGPAVAGTTYIPLSLLAVAGAVVAGLYAAVVVVGGLIALLRGEPWLLPGWSAVFPIAGAGLSLAGLMRVRRSDGTVGGGKLARGGLLLSVLAGAGYWAYAAALLLALARQGEAFGGDFLSRLSGGDTPGAFRLTVEPAERPPADSPHLHDVLETRFNAVTYKVPRGPLTSFAETDYVRILGRIGPETKYEPLGVEEWQYAHGGYRLRLLYRGDAPGLSFEVRVTVEAKEDKTAGVRTWRVVPEKTGLKSSAPLEANVEWARTTGPARTSRDYVEKEFVGQLREGNGEEAFLCTLPPAQRPGARDGAALSRLGLFLGAGLGSGAVPCPAPAAALVAETLAADDYLARAATLPGLDEFLAGGMVRADPGVYRAPADIRDETAEWVRLAFRRGNGSLAAGLIADDQVKVPLLRREGDRYVIEHDFAMRIPPKPAHFLIEGRVVVEGDAAEADRGSMLGWRIRGVYLVSGKAFPDSLPIPKPGP